MIRVSLESFVKTVDALYLKIPYRTPLIILFLCSTITFMLARNDWTPYDFSHFYASGQAFLEDNPPYEPLTVPELDIEPQINRNPPAWLFLFAPLSLLPFWTAYALMVAGVVATHALNAVLLLRNGFSALQEPVAVLWLAALTGFWRTLGQAQIYTVLALAATGAFFSLQRRPILAGALIGFLAGTKPNFLIWPLFLFLAGDRRIVWITAAGISVVGLVSLATGPEVVTDYVDAMLGVPASTIAMSSSLSSNLAKIGLHGLETETVIVIVLPLSLLIWRARASLEDASALALAAAPLASPLTWPPYTLFLLPILFSRPWSWPERILAGLIVLPLASMPILRELTGTACCAAFLMAIAIIAVPMIRGQVGESRQTFRRHVSLRARFL